MESREFKNTVFLPVLRNLSVHAIISGMTIIVDRRKRSPLMVKVMYNVVYEYEVKKMSTSIAFDTLSYAKKMVKVGFTQQQAEGQAEAMAEIIDEKLTTKQDIRGLDLKIEINKNELLQKIEANKNELLQKIETNKGELLQKIDTNKGELLLKIEANKNELLMKLGSMIAGSTGILVILMKLFRL